MLPAADESLLLQAADARSSTGRDATRPSTRRELERGARSGRGPASLRRERERLAAATTSPAGRIVLAGGASHQVLGAKKSNSPRGG